VLDVVAILWLGKGTEELIVTLFGMWSGYSNVSISCDRRRLFVVNLYDVEFVCQQLKA
jgi:hypothetical protein